MMLPHAIDETKVIGASGGTDAVIVMSMVMGRAVSWARRRRA